MWLFDQTPTTATIVSKSIIEDEHPILFVTHDEDDHGWQFLDGSDPPSEPMLVCLSHPVWTRRWLSLATFRQAGALGVIALTSHGPVAHWATRPNNSFKPKPLRGSA
jgi:hypothetical protein